MVSASSIGAAKAGGYARYLEAKTIAPERGDYYLTPDGELTQAPGRWLADPDTLDRLGIDPDGPVAGGDFISLMEGRHPGTGRFLRPEGAGGGRGGGIDVTFSAPKSVSTVWALAEPWQRHEIEAAHATAVEQTVGYMREHVPVVRRRYSGQVVEEPAKDLIAAEYQHTTARGVAGGKAPDPQLHSHVVITGVVREDDRLVATWSRPVFRSARELGAHYRAALAHELAERGYEIEPGDRQGRQVLRARRVSRRVCVRRSPAAPARSHGPPSVSEQGRDVSPSAVSYATSRWKTGARRPSRPVATWSVCGARRAVSTGSARGRRFSSSPAPSAPSQSGP